MLNRRTLRIKVFQSLFGYYVAIDATKEFICKAIEKEHGFDVSKHSFGEQTFLDDRGKRVTDAFITYHSTQSLPEGLDENEKKSIVKKENEYRNFVTEEARRRKRHLLEEVDNVDDVYLKLMLLPLEFSHLAKTRNEEQSPFLKDEICNRLNKSEAFAKCIQSNDITWTQKSLMKKWYEITIEDAALDSYFASITESGDYSDFLPEFFKKMVFKHKGFVEILEREYLHWNENKNVLRSMILKTLKNLKEGHDFEKVPLTMNGKEDIEFVEDIYEGVLRDDAAFDTRIREKSANWSISRISLSDKIIIKMALSETLNVPSVPVKVSVNEALEIAKTYSSPKSSKFVNGILDAITNDFISENKVKKSSRGLIDNK